MSILDKFPLVQSRPLSFYLHMSLTNTRAQRNSRIWLPLSLLIAVLILRVLRQHDIFIGTPNLSPLMALAFTGALMFPQNMKWWAWALVLPVVDVFSLGVASLTILPYSCYALAAWCGARLRGRMGVLDTLAGTLVCSVLFYLVTNTSCWLTMPEYAKNISGWVQALTVGIPGPYPTTLEFFRNSLVADFIGSLVLLFLYNLEAVIRNLRIMPLLGFTKPQTLLA